MEAAMAQSDTQRLLVDAIKARAMFYYAFYKEFSAEIGAQKTSELMKRAIYKRGLEIGKRFAKFAPDDMEGLKTGSSSSFPTRKAPSTQKSNDAIPEESISCCRAARSRKPGSRQV
jgi:hypothetical protein